MSDEVGRIEQFTDTPAPVKTTAWRPEELEHRDDVEQLAVEQLAASVRPVATEPWEPLFPRGKLLPHNGWWLQVLGTVTAQDGSKALLVLPTKRTAKVLKMRGGAKA